MATSTYQDQEQRRTWRKAAERAKSRDQLIPSVADPERRRQLEDDDAEWLRTYFPTVFYNPFTDEQLESIADIRAVLSHGTNKAKAAPRGGGKSSIITYLILKYALSGIVRFPLLIAATFGKSQQMQKNIKSRLASREPTGRELKAMAARGVDTSGMRPNLLADDYPLECYTARYVDPWPSRARNVTGRDEAGTFDCRAIHVEWGADHIILPTWEDEGRMGSIIKSMGWSSDELQGCNVYDTRPDVLILDDLDSRDSLASEQGKIADKIEEVIEKTLSGMAGQSRRLGKYFLCTITSEDAAAARYTDPGRKPAWNGQRVRAIEAWPDCFDEEGNRPGLWDEYIHLRQKGMQEGDRYGRSAFRLYAANRGEMDTGAVLSNPWNFEADRLPDGHPKHLSALQKCFDHIADHGLEAFKTEYQNDPPKRQQLFEVQVSPYIVSTCADHTPRLFAYPSTEMLVRGVDVRKIELHDVSMVCDADHSHRIVDYGNRSHGGTETTVEQAEHKILEGLHALAAEWDANRIEHAYKTDLVLIDKGWHGSWKLDDGQHKTWASQPVETFCLELAAGMPRTSCLTDRLRHWLPAKGAPLYSEPAPSKDVVIGDNWHINIGAGKNRVCSEVIWNAAHWHFLVEELFALDDDDRDRFVLFDPEPGGFYANHKKFGEHITSGADEMKKQLASGSRSRKPKFVRDHWWDALAMALVAQSVEKWFRSQVRQPSVRRSLSEMAQAAR